MHSSRGRQGNSRKEKIVPLLLATRPGPPPFPRPTADTPQSFHGPAYEEVEATVLTHLSVSAQRLYPDGLLQTSGASVDVVCRTMHGPRLCIHVLSKEDVQLCPTDDTNADINAVADGKAKATLGEGKPLTWRWHCMKSSPVRRASEHAREAQVRDRSTSRQLYSRNAAHSVCFFVVVGHI